MLIKSIQIENFRCFEKESISLEVLTAILGRNGSGKSTILSAIEVFYDVSATISEDDFYGKLTDREIRIQVVYGDLRPPAGYAPRRGHSRPLHRRRSSVVVARSRETGQCPRAGSQLGPWKLGPKTKPGHWPT